MKVVSYDDHFETKATYLQKGGNGSVFMITLKQGVKLKAYDSNRVVMKLFKQKHVFMFEQRISSLLPTHPNIIKYIGCVSVPDDLKHKYYNVGILYEYIDGNDIFDIEFDQEHEKLVIMLKVIDAVKFLHKHGIYHRDIKPENIMVRNGTNEPVIIDFDSGCIIKEKSKYATPDSICDINIVGTYEYMEPFMQGFCNIESHVFDNIPHSKNTQKQENIANTLYRYYMNIEKYASSGDIALYLEKCDNWALVISTYELLFSETPRFIENIYDNYYTVDLIHTKKPKKKHGCRFRVNSSGAITKMLKSIERITRNPTVDKKTKYAIKSYKWKEWITKFLDIETGIPMHLLLKLDTRTN